VCVCVCSVQVNRPTSAAPTEDCTSDLAHAQLLSSRVKLHEGVWLVDDNIRLHDIVMVKLSVCYIYMVSILCSPHCYPFLPPPKKEVMFLVRSVCLFVCLSVGLLANL